MLEHLNVDVCQWHEAVSLRGYLSQPSVMRVFGNVALSFQVRVLRGLPCQHVLVPFGFAQGFCSETQMVGNQGGPRSSCSYLLLWLSWQHRCRVLQEGVAHDREIEQLALLRSPSPSCRCSLTLLASSTYPILISLKPLLSPLSLAVSCRWMIVLYPKPFSDLVLLYLSHLFEPGAALSSSSAEFYSSAAGSALASALYSSRGLGSL